MSKFNHLILCGSISIDRIMNFNDSYKNLIQPDKMHVLSLSVLVDKMKNSHGGIAANIAYNTSLLGERSILIGSVGHDAKLYMKKLDDLRIDISHVHFSDLPTATFTVLTDKEDNQVGGFYVGAMGDPGNTSFAKWENTNSLVVVSANDPQVMRNQVSQCKKYKIPYMYDVSQQVSNIPAEDITSGIEGAEIVIVNDYEREVIVKRTGVKDKKLSHQVPIFITTLGSKGSIIEGKEVVEVIKVKAVDHTKVVDPTGAGDAYRAGFLYGYKEGLDLSTCGQIGSTVASYAIEKHGTQEHSFTKNQFNKRYQENFNKKFSI